LEASDSSKHIIAQLLCPVQRALIPGIQVSASFVHESRFCTRAADNKS
jgi:hypothetical protein